MLVKPQSTNFAKIKVVGVGGAGGNAINNMIQNYEIEGVEFIAVNTDAQALAKNSAETKLQIGAESTRGLGSGGNPQTGRKAAEESIDEIHEHLAGADMVFITAGMGGGTGTGASPVIAGVAKSVGALTVAIVEKPFMFEGKRRMETAILGVEEIKDKVDTLIVIPNQKLFELGEKNLSFLEALKKVDDVLAQAVKSIAQLITQTGLINLDFQDIRAVMSNAGTALMGIGQAEGEGRAIAATKMAINSPLLEFSINGAKGIVFNIAGGKDLGINEVGDAAKVIQDEVSSDCNVVFGANVDEELGNSVRVTVIATGFDPAHIARAMQADNQVPGNLPTRQIYGNAGSPQQAQSVMKTQMSQQAAQQATSKTSYEQTKAGYSQDDREEVEPAQGFLRKKPAAIEDDEIDDAAWETPAFLRNRKEY